MQHSSGADLTAALDR